MALRFRTKDGRRVGVGDRVWAMNGGGPYTIVDVDHQGLGLVYLRHHSDPSGGLFFAPEDIAVYIYAVRPVGF